jgi:predicted NUDIX family NTP pyrophosphohydrolase
MKNYSCGLLMYRIINEKLEVFLVHPGGPFFKNKDNGVWSIPKGLQDDGEDKLESAKREFEEETGIKVTTDKFIDLGSVILKSGKKVFCWGFEGDIKPGYELISNKFRIELPNGSGNYYEYPETDKAEFYPEDAALIKINSEQKEFIIRLKEYLSR